MSTKPVACAVAILDGKTRAEILTNPVLRKILWDYNSAWPNYLEWRKAGRREASKKLRAKRRAEWNEYVIEAHGNRCAHCGESFDGNRSYKVRSVPRVKKLYGFIPLCKSCKGKHVIAIRWFKEDAV